MDILYALIAVGILAYLYVTNGDKKPEPIRLRPLDPREIIYSDDEDTLLISKAKDSYFNKSQ